MKILISSLRLLLLAGALGLLATGCAWSLFDRGTVNYQRGTTTGRELLDLQEAKAKGALSDDEYLRARKAILEHTALLDFHAEEVKSVAK